MTVAILLAAGASSRTSSPKGLFDVGGKSLVQYQIDALLEGGIEHVYVVVGYHRDKIVAAIAPSKRLSVVENPQPQRGMFSSILEGIGTIREEDARVLIHPLDVPLPQPQTLRKLIGTEGKIVVPRTRGKNAHPVILEAALARSLPNAPQKRLDVWLRDHEKWMCTVDVDDARLLQNGNTDAELSQIFFQETS